MALRQERARRRPVRPLDDGTTELVHVLEFVLRAGDAVQPVIWLDRQLLDQGAPAAHAASTSLPSGQCHFGGLADPR